jgi:hypothetical protein
VHSATAELEGLPAGTSAQLNGDGQRVAGARVRCLIVRESGECRITRTNNRVQNAVKVCNRVPGSFVILQTLTAFCTLLFVLVFCTRPLAKMQGALFCNL